MRERLVRPFADGTGQPLSDVAEGILRHLEDDDAFHGRRCFFEVTSELASRFRRLPGLNDGFRPGFLGHIVTEMLIDRLLIERHPEKLDAYYESLATVNGRQVQSAVNRMARRETSRLAGFIELFVQSRFLFDYLDTRLLLHRLNQVMRRVKLNSLPDQTIDVLQDGRVLVQQRLVELLPELSGEMVSQRISPSPERDVTTD